MSSNRSVPSPTTDNTMTSNNKRILRLGDMCPSCKARLSALDARRPNLATLVTLALESSNWINYNNMPSDTYPLPPGLKWKIELSKPPTAIICAECNALPSHVLFNGRDYGNTRLRRLNQRTLKRMARNGTADLQKLMQECWPESVVFFMSRDGAASRGPDVQCRLRWLRIEPIERHQLPRFVFYVTDGTGSVGGDWPSATGLV